MEELSNSGKNNNEVRIPINSIVLEGNLVIPEGAHGIVVFAHGSGSSRHSSRNKYVAWELQKKGFGTLLFDLLTAEEERIDMVTAHLRFDINLLANRLVDVTNWLLKNPVTENFNIGYFGASTGAAAALIAATENSNFIKAIVSRGGRPDLAEKALPDVKAPTLFIVGGNDFQVIDMNRWAFERLTVKEKKLKI